jgi:hypothetical protein
MAGAGPNFDSVTQKFSVVDPGVAYLSTGGCSLGTQPFTHRHLRGTEGPVHHVSARVHAVTREARPDDRLLGIDAIPARI